MFRFLGVVVGMDEGTDPKNIKILFLSADPTDATHLRLDQEKRDIREKLQLSKHRERFVWESRESVRPEDMTQALLDYDPDIVHFSGHGLPTSELCFENSQGKIQPISPDDLALIFEAVESNTECVLLNACHTEIQAKAISQHIKFVIGMSKEIGDKAAIAFSVGFYKALGAGREIPRAYKFARAMMQFEKIPDHLTPVFYEKPNSSQIQRTNSSQIQRKITYEIVLSGTLNDFNEAILDEAIKHLRNLARENSLTVKEVRKGSIILVIEGSQDSFELFRDLFQENYLTEIMGLSVSNILERSSPNYRDSSNSTRKILNAPKGMNSSTSVSEIFTPLDQLVYVEKSSSFSELYYKMTVLGLPYCLIVDPRTRICSRIISKIDLVKLVPPGNALVPPEVQAATGITIRQSVLLNLIDNLEQRNVGELFPDQELISLRSSAPVSEAIRLLSTRHRLNVKYSYIAELPIIDDDHKLVGCLSYTDILKFFIKEAASYFLEITVNQVARMTSPDSPLYSLTSSQRLMDAFMQMESLGISSFPVVDEPMGDKLVGFVEDIQVMAYSHPTLAEELGKLEIGYLMSPLECLYTPTSSELIGNCLHRFLESSSGLFAPSTLAIVCNDENRYGKPVKRIQGLISYIDILKGWRQYYHEQRGGDLF